MNPLLDTCRIIKFLFSFHIITDHITRKNEATEIEFFKDVKINGKKIKSGRYTLYAIPYVDKWTVIVNKDTDTWGSFRYDQSKDVVRIDVPVTKNQITEAMTITFDKSPSGAAMNVYWDSVKVSLPIMF